MVAAARIAGRTTRWAATGTSAAGARTTGTKCRASSAAAMGRTLRRTAVLLATRRFGRRHRRPLVVVEVRHRHARQPSVDRALDVAEADSSSGAARVNAVPVNSARAVRPTRWM